MLDKDKLKCVDCGRNLDLRVVFDGCDWDSVKGSGSRFDYEIELCCKNCGRVYPVGRLKNEFAFCENIEKRRPYGKVAAEPQSGEDETPDCPPRYCGTCLPGDCKHSAGEGAG